MAECERHNAYLARPAYSSGVVEQTQCPPHSAHEGQLRGRDDIALVAELVYRISQPGEEKHVERLPREGGPDGVISLRIARGEAIHGSDDIEESGTAYDPTDPSQRERNEACSEELSAEVEGKDREMGTIAVCLHEAPFVYVGGYGPLHSCSSIKYSYAHPLRTQ